MQRQCGTCTLCCKLLPMKRDDHRDIPALLAAMVEAGMERPGVEAIPDFDKEAGVRCQHQRMKGCAIYRTRPFGCRYWNCRWLVNTAGNTPRPDRARYVLDIMPDFITFIDHQSGQKGTLEVIQIWVDPAHREAWRDPALLAYLEEESKEGRAAIIRYSATDAFTLIPPALSDDGEWHEIASQSIRREHSFAERIVGIATAFNRGKS